jgi:hypothetical protein
MPSTPRTHQEAGQQTGSTAIADMLGKSSSYARQHHHAGDVLLQETSTGDQRFGGIPGIIMTRFMCRWNGGGRSVPGPSGCFNRKREESCQVIRILPLTADPGIHHNHTDPRFCSMYN